MSWPAYITESEADDYWAAHGNPDSWTGADSATKDGALRSASEWLDLTYGSMWIGKRATADQVRDWPRIEAVDADGYLRPDDTIPPEVMDSTAYMANQAIVAAGNGTSLMPVVPTDKVTESEMVKVGPITIDETFRDDGTFGQPRYPYVDNLLGGSGLIDYGNMTFERF